MALGLLTSLGPFSIDLYLPAFKAIAHDLHVDSGKVPLTLSSYLIGISIGQLIYGPLLDKFGRKKPLCAGLILSMLASVGCYFASTLDVLVLLRFFQALGSCACTVAATAMVRDYFPVKENAKIFSFLMLVLGLSPIIAPSIGGYFTLYWGWHNIFILLLGIATLLLLIVIFVLPNIYKPDPDYSLKPTAIMKSFWEVLKEPQFLTYATCGALTLGCLFTFIAAAPNLFMGFYKMNENSFAWLFTALSGGFVAAGQLNRVLEKNFSSAQIIAISSTCQSACAVIFVWGTMDGFLGMVGVVSMIFAVLICTSVSLPNAAALTFAHFKRNAGTVAALFGAFEMVTGALVSVMITFFKTNGTLALASIMAILSILVFIISRLGEKRIAKTHATA